MHGQPVVQAGRPLALKGDESGSQSSPPSSPSTKFMPSAMPRISSGTPSICSTKGKGPLPRGGTPAQAETFQGQIIQRQALPIDDHPEANIAPALGHKALTLAPLTEIF
jgi:hypothetical protein